MAAVEGALGDRVEQLEAGTPAPAGSTSIFRRPLAMSLTFLAKSLGVFVEDVLRRPGPLEAEGDGLRTRPSASRRRLRRRPRWRLP